MSQFRNNQVGPEDPPQVGASSKDQENGLPETRQGESNSPVPPGQPQLPRPFITYLPGMNNRHKSYQFDDQSEMENPCRFCCHLGPAAIFFIVMNLGYCIFKLLLFLEVKFLFYVVLIIVGVVTYPVNLIYRPRSSAGFGFPLPLCFMIPFPALLQPTGRPSEDSFAYINAIVVLIWLGDVLTTVIFLSAVLFKPGKMKTIRILLINIFMWYNLCYPGILFHLVFYIGVLEKVCVAKWLGTLSLPNWIAGFAGMIAWVVCSGLVAKAYKNAIRRAIPERNPVPTSVANMEGEGQIFENLEMSLRL